MCSLGTRIAPYVAYVWTLFVALSYYNAGVVFIENLFHDGMLRHCGAHDDAAESRSLEEFRIGFIRRLALMHVDNTHVHLAGPKTLDDAVQEQAVVFPELGVTGAT